MSVFMRRWLNAVAAAVLCAAGAGSAWAAPGDPDSVGFTLEGCRNNGGITLPRADGAFICPEAAYTTGNLGKGWNELDLVPHRLTASAGNAAPATQTYTMAVVLDALRTGNPGYDVLSMPVLNVALSNATCSAATVGPEILLTPGLGGIDVSRARLVTITQPKGTTCVYDYYGRLAIGSAAWSGSSLHANLTNQFFTTAGIGSKEVSIPDREILPQALKKDMTASVASNHTWNLTKEAAPTNVSFGDMCAKDPQPQDVKITVRWEKRAATLGKVSITTNVYATNPAARSITVTATDKIYTGPSSSPGTLLDTKTGSPVAVPAGATMPVLTHTVEVDSSVAGGIGAYVNDVATASYTDAVTGVPILQTTMAKAQAQIQAGAVTNSTVNIADLEKIDPALPANAGLTFSVANPGLGAFSALTPNVADWGVTGISSSGSVEFLKKIYLDQRRLVTGGLMTDTATLVATDGDFMATAGPIFVNISSTATVTLQVKKSIDLLLSAGERVEVLFEITGPGGYASTKTITFAGGGPLTMSSDPITSLQPGLYKVKEVSALFYAAGSNVGVPSGLEPVGGSERVIDLDVSAGDFTKCSGEAAFVNVIPATRLPLAQVQKITMPALAATDPDFKWQFTLTGPGGLSVTAMADAGQGYVQFLDSAGVPIGLTEGSYKVTETLKGAAWMLVDPVSNECLFSVNLPQDNSKIFSCTFTNEKQGRAKVVKLLAGQPLTGTQTQTFTFELRTGATPTAVGTIVETRIASAPLGTVDFSTWLKPGSHYQMCERLMPGWQTSLVGFVPGGSLPDPDNSVVCQDFTVTAGELKSFTVDNTPPPEGRAHTIGYWKNWASCKKSGGNQAPVLDRTMAAAESTGIRVGDFYLHGSTVTPDVAPDCDKAVSLLNKSSFDDRKRASDPLFNMAAQLVAAELNYVAGAYQCDPVSRAIFDANELLKKYGFTGNGYTGKLSADDAMKANTLAALLDAYNNNKPGVCY